MQFLFTYCMKVLKNENVFTCTREHLKKKVLAMGVNPTYPMCFSKNLSFFFFTMFANS